MKEILEGIKNTGKLPSFDTTIYFDWKSAAKLGMVIVFIVAAGAIIHRIVKEL